jgi:hypothetical protein
MILILGIICCGYYYISRVKVNGKGKDVTVLKHDAVNIYRESGGSNES